MVNKSLSYGKKIEQKIKVSGLKFIGKPHLERGYLFDEIWTAHFGAAFEVCVRVWKMMIVDGLDDGLEIRHFVWSLYFLKIIHLAELQQQRRMWIERLFENM